MLNLSLLKLKNMQIKDKQKDIYRKIFQQICNIINHNAENGKEYCLFQVPEFILDEISYPFEECLEYLNYKLDRLKKDKQILEITFYEPNVYYIKWYL